MEPRRSASLPIWGAQGGGGDNLPTGRYHPGRAQRRTGNSHGPSSMAPAYHAFILPEDAGPQGGLTVMLTVLTTWISERIITVTAVTVLTVAAVPTTLVIA